ncbi:hypothetical protein BG000_006780 [Podila horticola]|nr:hypothetical protein BG000_006780 [Podila horticola]
MVMSNEFHPMVTRNRTPAPLTSLERAHARQGLDSWRTRILRDFYTATDSKQTVLSNAVIDSLLDKSAQFTTPESISQFLGNAVNWDPLLKKYWALQIFDIFFPVEDPVSTTQAYDNVFRTAQCQASYDLGAWRTKTFKTDYARILDDFGSNCTKEDLLSDAKLGIILAALTRLEGPDSIYPFTGWITRQSGYYEQVWELLQPMIAACADWKAIAQTNTVPPQPSPTVSSTYDPDRINNLGIKAFHPVAKRNRTPAPLTKMERAHARRELDSWRSRIIREFEAGSGLPKQAMLPDEVINDLLDESAQFTTSESISQFLHDKVAWIYDQTYWTLQIFDILFPMEDPVLTTQAYEDVLTTAKAQVRKALVEWRAKTLQGAIVRTCYDSDDDDDDLLSDTMLDIFVERFTSFDGPFSIYLVTAWRPRNRIEYQKQVWELLQPIVTECAYQKDILSVKSQTKAVPPLPPTPSTQPSLPSTPTTVTKPIPIFSMASTPEFLKLMNTTDTLRPLATRTRTPASLTSLEKARAREGLDSWRIRICREFETDSCIPKQTMLPDAVINGLLDKSAQFTTSESISQFLHNKVDWYFCQKYWCLEIFDILFPVKDPVITTQLYQTTLKTAKALVRKSLVAWRSKTFMAEHKRARKEFGFKFPEQALLSDAELDIFEERFTSLDGPYSVYPVTAWTPWNGIEHQEQVWELLRPIVMHCATVRLYISRINATPPPPSPSALPSSSASSSTSPSASPSIRPAPPSSTPATVKMTSTAAKTNTPIEENHSGTEATKEQAMKSLRVWRCRTYKSDYCTQNSIFNVEEVISNSVIAQLADQRAKIKTASMISSMVQWKPQQQRYLQEVFDILC